MRRNWEKVFAVVLERTISVTVNSNRSLPVPCRKEERISEHMRKKSDKDGEKMGTAGYICNYLEDRKAAIILYLATCAVFVAVCSLYQMNNLPRLFYAFVLSLFLWLCYGTADAVRYVGKRRKLALADRYLEQAAELLAARNLERAVMQKLGGGEEEAAQVKVSELETAYEELIVHLCREMSRQQSESERRRSERNDYYLMWAHQIKTPIAAMKLLVNGRDDKFLLTEELFKIEQYVEMVLYYLRLESMSCDMILREYCLHDMVKQVVKKYSVMFINSGLSLELSDFEEVKVLTDEKWFVFVLEQLLSNSIKYTKKGKISIYMQPDEVKTLVVEDTGMGIRAEDLPRIFERGFTGYNGRMDKKSTGIGLYLCRQVMNRLTHGIRVESREGKGTRVYLDLNREEEAF